MSLTPLSVALATLDDAPAIAALRTAAARELVLQFGGGAWGGVATERGVRRDLATSRVYVWRDGDILVATLRLATKKPWAIDTAYFRPCARPLYTTSMAVAPALQRRGVGRRCLDDLQTIAQAWPADAIRLDAYDAAAGAAPRCCARSSAPTRRARATPRPGD